MSPEISIIVPVYNVEKYLRTCLDSLLGQTLRDYELILVNDGSTDGSLRICEEYAARDQRIRVYSKPNGGLSDARNYGLDRAQAAVVGFVDSDDYVDADMFAHLLALKRKHQAQVAVAGVNMVTDDGTVYRKRAVNGETVMDRHDAMAEVLVSKRVLNAVWNKIFDRSLFEGIRFPVGRYYEDAFIIYDLLLRADRVAFTDQVYYNYRQNPDSITHKRFTERELDRVHASLNKIELMKRTYPDLVDLAERYLVYDCMMAMSKMERYDHRYDALLRNNIRRYHRGFISGGHTLSAKLFVLMACLSPSITVFMYAKTKRRKA